MKSQYSAQFTGPFVTSITIPWSQIMGGEVVEVENQSTP